MHRALIDILGRLPPETVITISFNFRYNVWKKCESVNIHLNAEHLHHIVDNSEADFKVCFQLKMMRFS